MVGPNIPFGGLACGLVLGPLPSLAVLCFTTPRVIAQPATVWSDAMNHSTLWMSYSKISGEEPPLEVLFTQDKTQG